MAAPTPRGLTFGSVAERYERYRPGYPDEVADLLLARGVRTAVEVGAGTGKATRLVAGRGVRVTAVEPDPAMVEVLRRTTNGLPVRIVRSTLEELPPQEPVDLLFSAAAWHWTDPETRWQDAARLLVPGGVFACLGGPTDVADPELAERVERVVTAALGDTSVHGAPGGEQWPANELTASPLFNDVEQHDLTQRYPTAADDLVGLMSTVSAFLLHDDRERLLAQVRALLPDPVEVRRDLVLQLARRI